MTKDESLKLTQREEEAYFLMVTTPDSLSVIANELCVSRATVATWVERIYQKMGVNNRNELIIKHYNELLKKDFKPEDK